MILLLALIACQGAKPGDTAADTADVYQMPDISGCTETTTSDDQADGVVDLTTEDLYDSDERLIHRTLVYTGIARVHYALTYDGACLVAYADGTDFSSETLPDTSLSYTQTCDDAGNALDREGTANGAAFTVAYANIYEGGDLVTVDATETVSGTTAPTTYRWVYGWEDGAQVYEEDWTDGAELSEEIWTYTGGALTEDAYSDLANEENDFALSYSYDAHGRMATEQYDQGSAGTVWTATFSWLDDRYHLRRTAYDYDGDGSEDTVESWTCTGSWPWSCTGSTDGQPWAHEAPDGVADGRYTEAWSCP